MLSMGLVQELRQGLELTGGMTSETVFPLTEDRLQNTDVQYAIKFVAARKNMDKYRSMMDFIFVETFPELWKIKCFNYYNGNGVQIIEDKDITDYQLKKYDVIMSKILIEVLLQLADKERCKNWSKAKSITHKIANAA